MHKFVLILFTQVKVSYEIEQHVKEAIDEARRAGGTDDEIRQAGER